MRIIVDSREQTPFSFDRWPDCEVTTGTLPTGDYSLSGLEDKIAIERKSLNDLLGCLTGADRDRFERELARARGLDCFAVVVESGFLELTAKQYRSSMNPHSACQSILAFQVRYGIPFFFAGSRQAAEYVTYSLLSKFLREAETRYKNILKNQINPPQEVEVRKAIHG